MCSRYTQSYMGGMIRFGGNHKTYEALQVTIFKRYIRRGIYCINICIMLIFHRCVGQPALWLYTSLTGKVSSKNPGICWLEKGVKFHIREPQTPFICLLLLEFECSHYLMGASQQGHDPCKFTLLHNGFCNGVAHPSTMSK